jgi:hypothetical protein
MAVWYEDYEEICGRLSEVLVLTAPVLGWKMDRLEVEVQNVV